MGAGTETVSLREKCRVHLLELGLNAPIHERPGSLIAVLIPDGTTLVASIALRIDPWSHPATDCRLDIGNFQRLSIDKLTDQAISNSLSLESIQRFWCAPWLNGT